MAAAASCICSPSIPVGCQVGYWLMIITAVAELLGDRRLREEEEEEEEEEGKDGCNFCKLPV